MCQKVKQADSAYIAGTYGRFDAVMSKGEGAHYEGLDGKRYIDFGTGIGVTLYCLRDSFGFLTAGNSYTDPVQMKLVLSPIALVVSAAVGLVTARRPAQSG